MYVQNVRNVIQQPLEERNINISQCWFQFIGELIKEIHYKDIENWTMALYCLIMFENSLILFKGKKGNENYTQIEQ